MILFGSIFCASAFAWDGDWTDAKSGNDVLYDTGSSTGKAGTDPPQKFLQPPPREYINVDPSELSDYYGKHKNPDYTPYALLRVIDALHYGDVTIPKGYYQLKAGLAGEGSPRQNLVPPVAENAQTPSGNGKSEKPTSIPSERVFIFKKLGNVIAVFPIHQVEFYKPKPKLKKEVAKKALAWTDEENRRPVLRFYYKNWLYSTYLQ